MKRHFPPAGTKTVKNYFPKNMEPEIPAFIQCTDCFGPAKSGFPILLIRKPLTRVASVDFLFQRVNYSAE